MLISNQRCTVVDKKIWTPNNFINYFIDFFKYIIIRLGYLYTVLEKNLNSNVILFTSQSLSSSVYPVTLILIVEPNCVARQNNAIRIKYSVVKYERNIEKSFLKFCN